jgi:hypothetical protein
MGQYELTEAEIMALSAEMEILDRDVEKAKTRLATAIQRVVDMNQDMLPDNTRVFYDPKSQSLVWEDTAEELNESDLTASSQMELLEEAEV